MNLNFYPKISKYLESHLLSFIFQRVACGLVNLLKGKAFLVCVYVKENPFIDPFPLKGAWVLWRVGPGLKGKLEVARVIMNREGLIRVPMCRKQIALAFFTAEQTNTERVSNE